VHQKIKEEIKKKEHEEKIRRYKKKIQSHRENYIERNKTKSIQLN